MGLFVSVTRSPKKYDQSRERLAPIVHQGGKNSNRVAYGHRYVQETLGNGGG